MRITVDNLMHQLLNPQVNFEIARVVAERMGLVQMPSPHMTVKYHHAKTGISIVRSFLQKRGALARHLHYFRNRFWCCLSQQH